MSLPDNLGKGGWSAATAAKVLPLLVAHAHSARPITYGDLSREATKRKWSHPVMPIAYRYVAGAIGFALEDTQKKWGHPIPPINALVVNEKSCLPGKGVDWFIKNYLRGTGSKRRLTLAERQSIVEEVHKDIYNFGKWDALLREYGLSAIELAEARDRTGHLTRRSYHWSKEGESAAHKALKNYVADNPSSVGLPADCPRGQEEFLLPSADKIDVLFQHDKWDIGVEVKAHNANDDDLLRGIYQCVKYRELLRAMHRVRGTVPRARSLLVVQRRLPAVLRAVAATLKVEWCVITSLAPAGGGTGGGRLRSSLRI